MTTPLAALPFGPVALGVGLGLLAYLAYDAWVSNDPQHATGNNGHGDATAALHGTLVPQPSFGLPAAPGLVPQSGVATRDGYEWGYLVGPGDTAGGIAEAIVGDDRRYQELVIANPTIKTVGDPGVYVGDRAYNFAPGTLTPGAGLLLPLAWSIYIDQTGHPRGGVVAWPKDTRVGLGGVPELGAPAVDTSTLSTGPTPGLAGTAGPAPADTGARLYAVAPGEAAPYGQAVALDGRAA